MQVRVWAVAELNRTMQYRYLFRWKESIFFQRSSEEYGEV
jgi:hypothetical protein